MDLARMRHEYESEGIDESSLSDDPFEQFDRWMRVAVEAELDEPNAMVLGTVDAAGQPWSRYILLKSFSPSGFDFYTNYESNKSNHIDTHAKASLTFGWLALRRQVNIAGSVVRVSDDESDRYWAVRPRGSQIGGWASDQSRPLADRRELLDRFQRFEADYDEVVPRPDHWGGWRVVPHTIEFWQGRQNRLHDRMRYVLGEGAWTVQRLAP